MRGYLEACVYPAELPAGLEPKRLPGLQIEMILQCPSFDPEVAHALERKLEHSCRKLCMMCLAAERAIKSEREFYSTTIQDVPALFGRDAIEMAYHLEAFILFARSSLDISSTIFGHFLFDSKRFDSFNELCKNIVKKSGGIEGIVEEFLSSDRATIAQSLGGYIMSNQADEYSWLSVLCGSERGRALRDKIAHQTGFPLDYEELNLKSEKESAVVLLSGTMRQPLYKFVETLRDSVIENFILFENEIQSRQLAT